MANQRLYLACEICMGREDTTFEQSAQYLTKYYPSSGWLDDGMLENIQRFFRDHDHRTLHGKYARIIYDSDFQQFAKARDEVLGVVGRSLERPRVEE